MTSGPTHIMATGNRPVRLISTAVVTAVLGLAAAIAPASASVATSTLGGRPVPGAVQRLGRWLAKGQGQGAQFHGVKLMRMIGPFLSTVSVTEPAVTSGRDEAFPGPGHYGHARFSYHGDLYHYSLYVPASYRRRARVPLLVMIHGCNTTADQQAAANEYDPIAERDDFIVLYPDVDAADVTHLRCWKGLTSPSSEGRNRGDAGAIAAMTRAVMSSGRIDSTRVYAMGMSSGAFETSILGATYPDLFAAIGLNSGAAYMRGSDGCLGAYKSGASPSNLAQKAFAAMGHRARIMPVILFHGDNDHTIPYQCGRQALDQWLATDNLVLRHAHLPTLPSHPTLTANGHVPSGHPYTIASYATASDCTIAQFWTIHGMDHFWSGGSPQPRSAPFTDPKGPGAAAASWAFFSAHRLTKPRTSTCN